MLKLGMRFAAGVRLATAALILAAVISPALAGAFALGPIRVTGDLNKRFKAEIPALTDNEDGLKAWIGNELDYRKVGIERPPFLANLSIEISDHPTLPGQKIIYITSSKPIYQPSFNLLVKASIGRGAILRNYFLAVDFQKNLNLSLPSDMQGEKDEMARIAKELRAKKPAKRQKIAETGSTKREKELAMLDQIRKEERQAIRHDEALREMMRKGKSSEPVKTAKAPKPKKRAITKKIQKPAPAPKRATPERVKKEAPKAPRVKPPIVKRSKRPVVKRGVELLLPVSAIAADNVYEAVSGDSVYKIAKKLGASWKNYDRVVVAIWQENKASFLKGNIHGLKAGADLDYSRVNETARSITDAEAADIINRQWPAWVKYRARYANIGRQTASIRPDVAEKGSKRGVELQNETLAMLADRTPKGLKARAQAGDAKEGATNEENESDGRPYVTHVASFKKQKAAQKFANLLSSKGYNAFVSLSFVPGKGYWHRVIVDRFKSKMAAGKLAKEVRRLGISKYSHVLKLPFAVKVGGPLAMGEIAKRKKELASRGISLYTLAAPGQSGGGEPVINTYVGAFRTEKGAMEAVKRLGETGLKYEVVKP